MSWSISLLGTTGTVSQALTAHVETLDGQSKIEYVDALPYLVSIVQQNFNSSSENEPSVRLVASGHGYAANGLQINRTLQVQLERS